MRGQLQSLRHEIGSMSRPDTVRESITELSPGGKAQALQWLVRFMDQAFPGIEHTVGVVRGPDPVRHQGGADAVAPQPGASEEARRLRARFHERCRHHPQGVRAVLPRHGPGRRNRSCPLHREEDLSRGILEAIDMDSYRAEKRLAMRIRLPDEDGEIACADTRSHNARH